MSSEPAPPVAAGETHVTAGAIDLATGDQPASARASIPVRWLVLLGVVVAAVRFLVASERDIFHALPDEAGMVAMSRWFAGRGGMNMFDSSTWQPGLSLLHAPVTAVVSDPGTAYRLGLLLGCLVAGVAAVVLAALVERLVQLGALASVVVAGLLTSAPAGISSTLYFWAESLVWLSFLATLACLLGYTDRPSTTTALRAGVVAAAGYAAHGRLLPLAVVVAVAVAADAWRSHQRSRAAAVLVASGGLLAAIAFGSRAVFGRIWDSPGSDNTPSAALSNLAHPLDVLDALAGQVWYLLAASAGLFGVGVVVLVRRAAGRGRAATDARAVLLTVGTMMAASAVFLAGRTVSSFPIYGRYNDAVAGPVVAVGVAWLVRHRHVRRGVEGTLLIATCAAATVALGAVVWALHDDAIAEGVTPPMVAGVLAYTGNPYGIDVLRVSVSAAAVAAVLLGTALVRHRVRPVLIGTVAAALIIVGALQVRRGSNDFVNSATLAATVVEVLDIVGPDEPFGVMFVPETDPRPTVTPFAQRRRAFVYQFFLVGRRFEEVSGPSPDDDVRFVFAPLEDPTMIGAGAVPVWQDPVIMMALWSEAGAGAVTDVP